MSMNAAVREPCKRPVLTVVAVVGAVRREPRHLSLLGVAFFPRTDAGQFTINLKVPTGTRIEVTNEYVAKVEELIRDSGRIRTTSR